MTIQGQFLQFGNGAGWRGNSYLTAVVAWSGIRNFTGAFIDCINLITVPTYLPPMTYNTSQMFSMTTPNSKFTGIGLIENWNTSGVIAMDGMFQGSSLNTNLANWDLRVASNIQNMLDNTAMNAINYSATLVGWANPSSQIIPRNIILGAQGLKYNSTATASRTLLITTPYNWQIIGDSIFVPQIILQFTGLIPNVTTIQLPLRNIYTTVTLQSTDGTTQQITQEYPNNPIYIPTQQIVTVTITNGFTQFGNGDISQIPWLGAEYLASITSWSGITSFTGAFINCSNLVSLPQQLPPNVTDTSFMFFMATATKPPLFTGKGVIELWDTSSVTNMTTMFIGCTNLSPTLDLTPGKPGYPNSWQTGQVISTAGMFDSCSQYQGGGIALWDTHSVTNMTGMFHNCSGLSPNLDFTPGKNGNTNVWNTANVTSMDYLFFGSGIRGLGIELWNTSALTTMANMFAFCNNVSVDFTPGKNGDLTIWNTRNVQNMQQTFYYAAATNNFQGISQWNTLSVKSFDSMLEGSTIDTNLGSWNIGNAISMTRMFNVSLMTTANYSATLAGWAARTIIPANINLGAVGLFYNGDAHKLLTSAPYNWTIFGDYNSSDPFIYGVLLNWVRPKQTNGTTIRYYTIKVVTQEGNTTTFYNTQFDETYFAIYTLGYNINYTFYVAAMTNKGLSAYSLPSSILYFSKTTPYITPKKYATDPNISTPLKYVNYIKADIRAVPNNPYA
jgi:hypothetical protein